MDAIGMPVTTLLLLLGLAGLVVLVLAVRWISGRMKQAELDRLRELLATLKPTDPEYNTVRALYAAAAVETAGWNAAAGTGASKSSKSDQDGDGGGDGGD